jgi:phosphoglycolate/pyridoxal phosphate phosphatase family enzyme
MIKGYIFDMDGVIWDGDQRIPHAVEKINELSKAGKRIIFLTNNSLRSRDTYVKRLNEFGITAKKDDVLISSYAAGIYMMKKNGPSKVYALGTDDMKAELREAGHTIVEKGADFVVSGLDKTVNYEKMTIALQNITAGAELIACAPDVTYLDNGEIKLGSGAIKAALEAASGKKATLIGKPSKVIMGIAKQMMGLKPGECMVVGDKLNTEIVAGKREGMKTTLVLTGETKLKEAQVSEIKPDYVIVDLRELA